jgi:hypothetical protein
MQALTVAVLCVALAIAGSGDAAGRGDETRAKVDVVAGTYGGVGIGATPSQIERDFGSPLATSGAAAPVAAARFRGPTFIPAPRSLGGSRAPVFRYFDTAFLTDGEDVYVVIVEAQGAETERGVAVGDALADARGSYDLICAPVVGSSDDDVYRACFGKVAPRRYVWFGGDPIEDISVARVPLTD